MILCLKTAFLWYDNSSDPFESFDAKRIDIEAGIKIGDVGQPNNLAPLPPVDLYLNFEKSSWKNQFRN